MVALEQPNYGGARKEALFWNRKGTINCRENAAQMVQFRKSAIVTHPNKTLNRNSLKQMLIQAIRLDIRHMETNIFSYDS